tara:strand:+ start:286 stop:573 length:288 start_codon:yes stop_codon:yes gene_type:complete
MATYYRCIATSNWPYKLPLPIKGSASWVHAALCNGDMVALGACLALQSKNLQPGKDISVIGFDNVMDANLVTPTLTTMTVHPYNLGQVLAETILR